MTLCFYFWDDLLFLFVSVHTLILFPGLGKDNCRAGAGNGERYDPEEDVAVVAGFHALKGGDLPGLLLAADGADALLLAGQIIRRRLDDLPFAELVSGSLDLAGLRQAAVGTGTSLPAVLGAGSFF